MIKHLVSIPSISESKEENLPCLWIYDRLIKKEYFVKHPENIQIIETPLEGSDQKLKALLVTVKSERKTTKTILFISHFDVVSNDIYGEIKEYAFDCDKLSSYFNNKDNDTLYGRGTMDMKAGVALEVDLIEDFADDTKMFDVNIIVAFVGDEENTSAGMRRLIPVLSKMKSEGTEFLVAINTEPGEAGCSGENGPMVFTGTLGKIMPAFYAKGLASHVGDPYKGFSSALYISKLICEAEGNPKLTDGQKGKMQPSWVCLDVGTTRENYSVTIPDEAYAYFNCFTVTQTPYDVMAQMKKIARKSFVAVNEQYKSSFDKISIEGFNGSSYSKNEVKIFTLEEIINKAKENNKYFEKEIKEYIKKIPSGDMRKRGIKIAQKICEISAEKAPYVLCFFLPPWMPGRMTKTDNDKDKIIIDSVCEVKNNLLEKHNIEMKEIELFGGLCDLSYVGAKVNRESASLIGNNIPGWGELYSFDVEKMNDLGMPVINMGPSGSDPHNRNERLNLKYSIEILPSLLRDLVKTIAKNTGK